jgi:hypothetical protein
VVVLPRGGLVDYIFLGEEATVGGGIYRLELPGNSREGGIIFREFLDETLA